MQIELLPEPVDHIIAWELQLGQREGRFVLASDGSVQYLHLGDDRIWFVASDVGQFRETVQSWRDYEEAVVGIREEQCLEHVQQLRDSLTRLGVLRSENTFWSVILEQVEAGLL